MSEHPLAASARHLFLLRFHHPAADVFGYLGDPRNRAQWQSSLRRVEPSDVEPGPGATWTDVTVAGVNPRMRIVTWQPDDVWAEAGEWHGVSAYLRLDLRPVTTPDGEQTDVAVSLALRGRGLWRFPVAVARRLAPSALRKDLHRADRSM